MSTWSYLILSYLLFFFPAGRLWRCPAGIATLVDSVWASDRVCINLSQLFCVCREGIIYLAGFSLISLYRWWWVWCIPHIMISYGRVSRMEGGKKGGG
ncbi:hypothetical protein L873DRAFT_1071845 [Choiromyces venosus 120613-1]|uniref:Uncharacterized protein n=1 Tax=Choiromyces venosus 120613-1 TaxID=1336337 RepID=A0A3N4K985_9PEZI|nr:hypothetical protein L873DRAFT_1071845 [Choiromyces venosus 120613-1]